MGEFPRRSRNASCGADSGDRRGTRSAERILTPPQSPSAPLLIDFANGTSLVRERHRPSALPIVGNGPPGTFVHFPQGFRVSLPTDQVVLAEDGDGHVRVGFGGMAFVGLEEGRLAFLRVRELHPDDQLSPARSHKMLLEPEWVMSVAVEERVVWPQ